MGKFSKSLLLQQTVNSSNSAQNLLVRAHMIEVLADDVETLEKGLLDGNMRLGTIEASVSNPRVGIEQIFDRELTDAEVAAMFAGPIGLVPAPGANRVIQLTTDPIFIVKFGTAAYTGGGAITLRSGTTIITAVLSTANSLLATANRASFVSLLDTANGVVLDINQPINIQNITAAFVQGTSTSKLTVRFKYIIHEIV